MAQLHQLFFNFFIFWLFKSLFFPFDLQIIFWGDSYFTSESHFGEIFQKDVQPNFFFSNKEPSSCAHTENHVYFITSASYCCSEYFSVNADFEGAICNILILTSGK